MSDPYTEVALDLMSHEAAELAVAEAFGVNLPMFHQSRTIARIDNQIAALEEQKLRVLSQPEDKYQEGDVVWFTKTFGSSPYTYAALKHGGRWYVTQSGTQQRPMPWDALLEFVGDNELWTAVEWECIQ